MNVPKQEEIALYVNKNFNGRRVKPVTIEVSKRNIHFLQEKYKNLLYGPKYQNCIEDVFQSDELSMDTKKARVVNWFRMIRAMSPAQFKKHFHNSVKQADVVEYLCVRMSLINHAMKDELLQVAEGGTISEKYVPWTFIYNRAEEFVNSGTTMEGNADVILKCRLIAHLMILDHPPRRNLDYMCLRYPFARDTLAVTRERAMKNDLNIWHSTHIFINDYKTKKNYGEYVMELKPHVTQMFKELQAMSGQKSAGEFIFAGLKIPEALKFILGITATVNTLRHSFLTFYYSHNHGHPIFLHEKNDISLMMANAVNTHDRYIIRNKPYKNDKMQYYMDVVAQRNKNISESDKGLIGKYADGNEKTVLVSKKAAPRRQSPLVKEVLEHYKHLFVGKSIEEKRKERPYLFLSQCDETFRNGEKVKDILGSDVDLIRKWCSKITR